MEIKIPYGKTFQTLNIEEGFELLESKIQELEAGADGGAIVRAAMDSPIHFGITSTITAAPTMKSNGVGGGTDGTKN